ncbi:MAG: porin family protein [Deltaproteobacteria bacterium]|nr:porin family protein [Deltaproteobacteria bacterium]
MLFAINASAQDHDQVRSYRPYSWTGFYFGFQGSYLKGTSDWAPEGTALRLKNDTEGGMGGFYIGYLYQTPVKIVVGVEAETNYGRLSNSSACPNPSYSCHTEVNWIGSLRGRLGYALGRFMPYVAIGWAYAGADTYVTYLPTGDDFGSSNSYLGFTPGAGLEFAVTNNFLIRGEYAYYDFGRRSATIQGDEVDIRLANHAFKLGVGLTF